MIFALGRHLAESTIFAFVVGLLCVCIRRRGPGTRHALWLIAVAKFAVPMTLFSWLGERLAVLLPAGRISATVPAAVSRWVISPAISAPASASASGSFHSWIAGLVIGAWLAGSTVTFALWLRKLRVSRSSSECRGDVEQTFLRLKQRMGLQRGVRLRLTDTIGEPALAGFRKPVVLIPAGLAGKLSAEELESVILHELAHAKRWDNWTAALAHAVSCVFWFYPVSWWIERQLRIERELACDEMVIRSGAAAADYVAGILKVCRFSVSGEVAGVSGVCGSSLKDRMEAIMSLSSNMGYLRGPKWLFGILVAGITVAPLLVGLLVPSSARTRRTVSALVDRQGHLLILGSEVTAHGTSCTVAEQRNAPAQLVSVTFGVKNAILGAKLQNAGARRITQYRIGWAVVYSNGNIETSSGPPINVPTGIAPGALENVPAQGESIAALSKKGAREIMVFVQQLAFARGNGWMADISSIETQAQEHKDVARVGMQGESEQGKSKELLMCDFGAGRYPEGTVIQEGNGPQQMCARIYGPSDPKNPLSPLTPHPIWIRSSEAMRARSATVVRIPLGPPAVCAPTTSDKKGLCECEDGGYSSPNAMANSANSPFQLQCGFDGKWIQTKTPNVVRR